MLISLLLFCGAFFSFDPDARIAESVLEKGLSGQHQSFLIILQEQADLSDLGQVHGKQAKGREAFSRLRQTAERTQAPLLALLRELGAPARPFHIVNMIQSHGDLELIRRVAAHPAVAYIAADGPIRLTDYREEADQAVLRGEDPVTWGIARILADSVWAMGYTGQGVVIGGQDTGYEWEHPALKATYRGWNNGEADHNYHWHDAIYELDPLHNDSLPDPANNPCGLQSPVPCDDNNHGTHTMGTMAGDREGDLRLGIAPDARWIGCRNMERGWGKPSTYIECFEWFLAPTDLDHANPDPDLAPHVIANSWGCPPIEGCDPSNFALMEMVVDNLKAAGVVVVVSAGNSGSGCGSVNNPAAIFGSSFAVGATRDDDAIANFSSRGPVTVDGSGRLKPDISAPGVQVRSAIRNGGFASFSGTSMAGPHVAGAVALILSARPDLAGEVDLIQEILQNTSVHLTVPDTCGAIAGTDRPNHAFGWGRINVYEAVQAALDLTSSTIAPATQAVKIYPNPFRDALHLQVPGQAGPAIFSLYDAAGRLVFRQDLGPGPLHLMAMPRLYDGFYAYLLETNGQRLSGVLQRI